MLKNDLYKVVDQSSEEDSSVLFTINIDPKHKIFNGHFPGQPVLPGVCQIEMVKELVSTVVGRKLRLLSSGNIKYIEIVDPNKEPQIQMQLKIDSQDEVIKVNATSLFKDGRANFKFTGTFN